MPHMQRVQRLTVCGIYRYQLLSIKLQSLVVEEARRGVLRE